jgi:trk system potassium uptake protein TrkH
VTRVGSRQPVASVPIRAHRFGVDIRGSLNLVGWLLQFLGVAFLFPAAIAVIYGESTWPFLASAGITSGFGWALHALTSGKEAVAAREGYLVVSLVWLLIAVFGSLPYLLSEPQLSRPVDALFESMSGFSTTSSSVVTDVEALSRSIAMWRQFTLWVGGLGIIVLALGVLPRLRVGGRQAMAKQEMPGPEFALEETIREVARRFVVLYIAITAAEILVLATLGWTGVDAHMDLYRAVAHSFTTLGTGGFSTEARSVEPFAAATQWTIALFMITAGSNFALLYAGIVRRRVAAFARDEEFRTYVGLLAAAVAVVVLALLRDGPDNAEQAVRHAVFNTTSMMTTTGFANTDFNQWPALAVLVLFGVVMIGPSAGSTGGSIKVVRHLIIAKMLRREVTNTVHPEMVLPLRVNRAVIDDRTLRAIIVFVYIYVGVCCAGAIALLVDATVEAVQLTPFQALAASITTLGNSGPALGFAGPMGSFAPFSDFSTIVMTALMYLGRLEIIPILVVLTRSYWRI